MVDIFRCADSETNIDPLRGVGTFTLCTRNRMHYGPIKNKTAGKHRHIFCPTTNILINFCKRLKTKQNCFDISFQRVFTKINSTADFCTLCKRLSRFSVEKFLSHSDEKFRPGTLLCFRKFLSPKNVRDKRGGGYHDFLSKLFCLTVPKNFVEEHF